MPRPAPACGCRSRFPEPMAATPHGVRRRSPPPWPRRSTTRAPSCGKLLERRGDPLVIAERHNPVADDLAGFMALAGNQQHIAGAKLSDRGTDRLVAVADLD